MWVNSMKNQEQTTDRPSVSVKRATVEAFLTAAKEFSEFEESHPDVIENAIKSEVFERTLDDLYQKEEEKALDLYAESGENISHFTFMSLASACYDALGPVVEIGEKYCKILQLLGIEVTE